ncbi:alpha/beta fold hydrolase [Nonomuraea phyllanthi]|uniref:Alpha/beta fold hydrolase n=1 Tax=Nonomuraea phyllanthi TaxID=2219224 RepID=A0A5C4W6Y6_9ACTN|nr:alpha/beta fold hydrolase [Nonomuraea phyllanthi]KAB8192329.1 alpha/beta fold hydrolase [Nonomuraea phyllanthi]QFY11316.1 alpha/beta fold hydrolase [Nonomuraea phyllanthi]
MIIRVVLALALTAPPVTPPADAGTGPCPVAVPARTTCGFLEVPERRDAPERKIKVGYAVHVSTARDRRPDPVVYMGGGPASASMQLIGFLSQMFPDRDVVTVEQRGSRYSQPVLGCPETAEALLGQLRRPPADLGAAAARCRERLQGQGVDLRGYNTKEIVADVVALREKLGYTSWNLFGVSYSTRVMVDVAAADPEGVRSVVLDSYLPESVGWYDDAERNLADTAARLGVKDALDRATARLNASPARVTAVDPLLGREFEARISGDDLATIMAEALHEAGVVAVAPAMIRALAEGRDELLRPLADAVGDGLVSHEFGLYHAVQCQDEVPFNTFTPRSRLFTINGDKAVCDAWRLPKSEPVNASTRAPVYVVGGRYDPTTPTRTSRPAAESLPGARFEEFSRASHAVFLTSACARRKIYDFVADPATRKTDPCQDAASAGPGDLHVTAAPYRISKAPWLAAPFALFALVSLVQLVAAALKGRATAAFGGLAGVAFAGLVVQSVYDLAKENEVALAVGVPGTVVAYGWIAAASVVLTGATLARDRAWPRIVAAVVGAGFLVWWFTWFL